MVELPGSVRVALFVTAAWRTGEDVRAALRAALPDVDLAASSPLHDTLDVWRTVGEHALLAALPGPGSPGRLRLGPALGEAVEAGEALLAPTLGEALVGGVVEHGHPGRRERLDTVLVASFVAVSAQPVPRHVVESADARSARRALLAEMAEAAQTLDRVGGTPFDPAPALAEVRAALPREIGLPPGLTSDQVGALVLAGTVRQLVDVALAGPHDGPSAVTVGTRQTTLLALGRAADRALEDATTAAVATLAGWTPTR